MTDSTNPNLDQAIGVGLPPFSGISTFMRARPTRDLNGVDVAVLGVPYDASVTNRTGCRFGPRKIRECSSMIWGYHTKFAVTPMRDMNVIDYGDVDVIPTDAVVNLEPIQAAARAIIEAGAIPLTLGGDHSISFPLLREVARKHGKLSVIHFDSHMDTWEGTHGQRYSHATPFRRAIEEGLINTAEYIQIGIRGPEESPADIQDALDLGAHIIPIEQVMDGGTAAVIEEVRKRITGPVYVSLDIDVADPAYAPGTGTPEVGGLTSYQILQLIRGLRGLNFVGFDVVEVSPPYDHADITSILAANIAFEFLSLIAVNHTKR
jgi:agmatinase/guanidinopropionase